MEFNRSLSIFEISSKIALIVEFEKKKIEKYLMRLIQILYKNRFSIL